MNTQPINAIIAPAQTSSKPASNDDASSQNAQGFGNVLARRVADSSSSAKKNTEHDAKDTKNVKNIKASKDAKEAKDAKETTSSDAATDKAAKDAIAVPDMASLLPAEMMAALLAQQNPNAAAKAAAPLQTAVDAQAQTSTPELSLVIATAKGEGAQPAELATNATLAQTAATTLDTTRPDASAASNNKQTLTDKLKATVNNEVATAVTVESSRTHNSSELSATIQQPSIATVSQVPISNTSVATAALSGQLTVHTPVSHPSWGNEFSQKITWLTTQRDQSAELHLNPPQLGPLDVVLKVSGDQATALFTSPHAAVREAIEQALPKLRELLADNGIMLGNATVGDQAPQKDQNDSSRAQQGSGNAADSDAEIAATGQPGGGITTISRHNGMVDTFA